MVASTRSILRNLENRWLELGDIYSTTVCQYLRGSISVPCQVSEYIKWLMEILK